MPEPALERANTTHNRVGHGQTQTPEFFEIKTQRATPRGDAYLSLAVEISRATVPRTKRLVDGTSVCVSVEHVLVQQKIDLFLMLSVHLHEKRSKSIQTLSGPNTAVKTSKIHMLASWGVWEWVGQI